MIGIFNLGIWEVIAIAVIGFLMVLPGIAIVAVVVSMYLKGPPGSQRGPQGYADRNLPRPGQPVPFEAPPSQHGPDA
jgi:hypothetical protein